MNEFKVIKCIYVTIIKWISITYSIFYSVELSTWQTGWYCQKVGTTELCLLVIGLGNSLAERRQFNPKVFCSTPGFENFLTQLKKANSYTIFSTMFD